MAVNELFEISKKLTRAANRWPLSEDRRLDVLRLAKRIRNDGMKELDENAIDLLLISAAANGCRYVDDFADESGLSKKEVDDILHRMWQMGTFEKGEERNHDRGRPRVVFILAREFSSKENNWIENESEFLP